MCLSVGIVHGTETYAVCRHAPHTNNESGEIGDNDRSLHDATARKQHGCFCSNQAFHQAPHAMATDTQQPASRNGARISGAELTDERAIEQRTSVVASIEPNESPLSRVQRSSKAATFTRSPAPSPPPPNEREQHEQQDKRPCSKLRRRITHSYSATRGLVCSTLTLRY